MIKHGKTVMTFMYSVCTLTCQRSMIMTFGVMNNVFALHLSKPSWQMSKACMKQIFGDQVNP